MHRGQPNRTINSTAHTTSTLCWPSVTRWSLFQISIGNSVYGVCTYDNIEFRPWLDPKIRQDGEYSCRLEFVDKNTTKMSSSSSSFARNIGFGMHCSRCFVMFLYLLSLHAAHLCRSVDERDRNP